MSEQENVRMAEAADYDRIYHYLAAEHGEDFASATMISAFRTGDWPTHCWIALADEKVVGIITTKNVNGCIYVSRDYRCRGIGSALMQAREDYIRQQGIAAARVDVAITNTGSLALHSKHGYCLDEPSFRALEALVLCGASLSDLTGHPPLTLRLAKVG